MPTAAQLVERNTGLIDLIVRNRAGFSAYLFGAATTLDNAFAGTTGMFLVPVSTQYRSKTLRLQRRGFYDERTPGLTRATFNLNDFASPTVPGDTLISFITVSEQPIGFPFALPQGPILVVPPPGFFSSGRRILPIVGTAPDVAGQANNLPPVAFPGGSLNLVLPKFADQIIIENTGSNSIFVSFDEGLPEWEIPPSTEPVRFQEVGVQQVFLRADGGTSTFQLAAAIVNGLQG